jgi:hypothetical protein
VLADGASNALTIFSMVVLVAGFVGVFALWFFVFCKPTEDEIRRRERDGG